MGILYVLQWKFNLNWVYIHESPCWLKVMFYLAWMKYQCFYFIMLFTISVLHFLLLLPYSVDWSSPDIFAAELNTIVTIVLQDRWGFSESILKILALGLNRFCPMLSITTVLAVNIVVCGSLKLSLIPLVSIHVMSCKSVPNLTSTWSTKPTKAKQFWIH